MHANTMYPILDKHHRGGKYPLLRVFTTIIMRELNVYTLIGDIFSGVPSAYATFVGYDEVAHHSGVGVTRRARCAAQAMSNLPDRQRH